MVEVLVWIVMGIAATLFLFGLIASVLLAWGITVTTYNSIMGRFK